MHIFGVRIDNITAEDLERKIGEFLASSKKGFYRIATVNPEFLVFARSDTRFHKTLNASDLNVADGTGLTLAFWKAKERFLGRHPGADLMEYICQQAQDRQLTIFLAIREDSLSTLEEIRHALQDKYPNSTITGQEYALGTNANPDLGHIHNAQIVLCNFGAPEQEYFLESLRKSPGDIRLVMGVGGTFDYLTGRLRRAPRWMRRIGLEWLWRLFLQPSRFRRIIRAVIIFPWAIMVEKNRKKAYTEAINS